MTQQRNITYWNACGITALDKLAALQAYVYRHNPQIVLIQEAFVGQHEVRTAPSLTGFFSYIDHPRHGLITYIHSSLPQTPVQLQQ